MKIIRLVIRFFTEKFHKDPLCPITWQTKPEGMSVIAWAKRPWNDQASS